jgi:TIR domain-containing protein
VPLADIVPLDWWDTASRSRDHLLRSVRATSTAPTAPTTSDQGAQAGSDRRVFISYSRQDREIAARVADRLTEGGLATWLDFEQLNAGDSWTSQSQMALNRSDAVVVLVSPALLGNRQSLQEISYAQNVGVPVIPVRVGKVGDRDLPLELARLQMVDATNQPLEAAVEAIAQAIRTGPTG